MKIDISIGELVDKTTILSIKLVKVKNPDKLINIKHEYELLSRSMKSAGITTNDEIYLQLVKVNQNLWEIEDKIRIKEKDQQFDDEFIKLARSVYIENDKRSEIKKKINIKFGSDIVEEKEYVDYQSK